MRPNKISPCTYFKGWISNARFDKPLHVHIPKWFLPSFTSQCYSYDQPTVSLLASSSTDPTILKATYDYSYDQPTVSLPASSSTDPTILKATYGYSYDQPTVSLLASSSTDPTILKATYGDQLPDKPINWRHFVKQFANTKRPWSIWYGEIIGVNLVWHSGVMSNKEYFKQNNHYL